MQTISSVCGSVCDTVTISKCQPGMLSVLCAQFAPYNSLCIDPPHQTPWPLSSKRRGGGAGEILCGTKEFFQVFSPTLPLAANQPLTTEKPTNRPTSRHDHHNIVLNSRVLLSSRCCWCCCRDEMRWVAMRWGCGCGLLAGWIHIHGFVSGHGNLLFDRENICLKLLWFEININLYGKYCAMHSSICDFVRFPYYSRCRTRLLS